MSIFDITQKTRTVRRYEEHREISPALLNQMVDVARLSGGGPQKLDNMVSYKSGQIQEDLTMGKKRKTHSPQFKAKVALAAIQNDETMSQIASRFGVHPTMVSNWKRQMLEGAVDIFDKSNKSRKQAEAQTDELFRQIGQLKVENDFLARKLGS